MSSTKSALSLHEAEEVAPGVSGSEVGEAVGGRGVGTVKPGLVGGRVEVTKRGGAGVAVSFASVETFTQEVNVKMNKRVRVIFLSMVFLL